MPDIPPELDLLILADLHYVGKADHRCPIPERNAWFGKELAERAVRRAVRQGPPDAIALMGDLVDNGLADRADEDLAAIAKTLARFEIPLLVVPGNHDGRADRLLGLFGDHLGVHELGGYQLITLATPYDASDRTAFAEADLAIVARAAEAAPGKPVIVLHHNPVRPRIDEAYPYNPTNADAVAWRYAEAGVLASISGHYHAGLAPESLGGVTYLTAPALCKAPFRFLRLFLRGRRVEVAEHALSVSYCGAGLSAAGTTPSSLSDARSSRSLSVAPPAVAGSPGCHAQVPTSACGEAPSATGTTALWDIHCHTHYADCRDDVDARGAIQRRQAMGLCGLVLAEHSTQLYVGRQDFWSARFFNDPDLLRRNRDQPVCRMDAYLAEILPLRNAFVRLGLEVDSDAHGGITLLDQDKSHWDLLIGAVHWVPFFDPATATAAERARRFMDATESVVRAGVDVLAHPFRYFRRNQIDRPTELYRPLARLLAETGVAAEINFHTNDPDPAFFAICLEEGVKIALGSDSHSLWEVGELWPHLRVLAEAGAGGGLTPVLFTPGEARKRWARTDGE